MLNKNQRMSTLIETIEAKRTPLPAELLGIVRDGFVERDGCYFLRYLSAKETNVGIGRFPDKTGFECFVNSIHIDDYCDGDYLLTLLNYTAALIERWHSEGLPGVLNVIMSVGEGNAVGKCHLLRPNESWLDSDLEGYEEAILVVDSTSDFGTVLSQENGGERG